jgi:hypothetical protein
MWLFPFRRFRLETRLSPEEVAARLAAAIGSRWRVDRSRQFTGKLNAGKFRAVRLIRGGNSFLPSIRGRISANVNGSIVEGSMMLHPVILIIFAIALVSTILRLCGFLPGLGAPGPYIVFALFYMVAVGVFHYEACRDLRLLRVIFTAESDEPALSSTA